MKLIKDLTNERLRLIAYGKAGTGKTKFVGSAAMCSVTAPALLVTLGGNPVSLKDNATLPTIVELETLKDFNSIYEFLAGGQTDAHPLHKALGLADGVQFKTLIVDGASYVQQKVMQVITGHTPQSADFSRTEGGTEIGDYKENVSWWNDWAGFFFGLADRGNKSPIHVMITALEREPAMDVRSMKARAEGVKGPPMSSQVFRPMFYGQASAIVEGYAYITARMISADRVSALEVADMNKALKAEGDGLAIKRAEAWNIAMFTAGPDYVAKDQYLRLPSYLPDPTIQQICDYVYRATDKPNT